MDVTKTNTENHEGPYDAAWKDLKFRRRLFWGMVLGWMPFGMLMALFRLPDAVAPFVFIPYMIGIAGAHIYHSFFKCPRCENYFYMRGPVWFLSYHNTFSNHCLNCGLPAYAKFNPGESQQREFENRQPILVRIFGFLFGPLVAVYILEGILLVIKGSGNVTEQDEIIFRIFGYVQGAGILLLILTIASIRKPDLKDAFRKLMPLWAKITFIVGFAGSIIIFLYAIVKAPRVPHPSGGLVPEGTYTLALGLLNTLGGLLALFYTHKVCRHLYVLKCPNGHETPQDAVRCPTCGTLLP